MPARDMYHDAVRNALVKDGWTITHDPLRVVVGRRDLYVDLGAERLFAAERAGQKIAVEVKSFAGLSPLDDLEKALGQYVLYRTALADKEPERVLHLAVPEPAFALFEEPLGKLLLDGGLVRILGFDPKAEAVTKWIP